MDIRQGQGFDIVTKLRSDLVGDTSVLEGVLSLATRVRVKTNVEAARIRIR